MSVNKLIDVSIQKGVGDTFDGEIEAVLSTDTLDRTKEHLDYTSAKMPKTVPMLFNHSYDNVIGTWHTLKRIGNKILAKGSVAKEGTSVLVDTVRSLLSQGHLKTTSISVTVDYGNSERDEKTGFMRLAVEEILEGSIVPVPANAEAVITSVKSMNLGNDTIDIFRKAIESDGSENTKTSKNTPYSQVSDNIKGSESKLKNNEGKIMSLSVRIKKLQDEIVASRTQMEDIESKANDRDLTDEEIDQLDALSDDIEVSSKQLAKLEKIESSKAKQVKEMADKTTNTPVEDAPKSAFGTAARATSNNTEKGHKAMATIATVIRSHVEQRNPEDVAKIHYKDEPEIALLSKAVSAPAQAGTAGWAQELVQDTWGEFLELLRDTSIYAQLPGPRLSFDGYGTITLPRQGGRGNLSGAFVAEGNPIPVKQGSVDSVTLQPKGLKVISSFTRELAMRSNPSIEAMIRSQILGDTAEALDTHFMSTTARSATVPGGIQDAAEIGAANINTSAGATLANILSDTSGMIERLINNRFTNAVWVINPIRVLGLMDVQDASSGVFVFKNELANGMFRGFPYISSSNVTADVVALVADNAMAFANEYGPSIDMSTSATLHYEDTTPAPLVDGPATPPDPVLTEIAAPQRSLFQTDSLALRFTMGLDHRLVRANGVQVLDTVSW